MPNSCSLSSSCHVKDRLLFFFKGTHSCLYSIAHTPTPHLHPRQLQYNMMSVCGKQIILLLLQLEQWITNRYARWERKKEAEVAKEFKSVCLCKWYKCSSLQAFVEKYTHQPSMHHQGEGTPDCMHPCLGARLMWMVVIELTILSPSTCEEGISAEWQIAVSLLHCPRHMRHEPPSPVCMPTCPSVCVH